MDLNASKYQQKYYRNREYFANQVYVNIFRVSW